MFARIAYGFWKKKSTVSSVCSLSCDKSERNWHPHKPKREKPKTVRAPENIGAVTESVCEALSISIHRRSQQLKISKTLFRRILHKDHGMTTYKVQLV